MLWALSHQVTSTVIRSACSLCAVMLFLLTMVVAIRYDGAADYCPMLITALVPLLAVDILFTNSLPGPHGVSGSPMALDRSDRESNVIGPIFGARPLVLLGSSGVCTGLLYCGAGQNKDLVTTHLGEKFLTS